MKRTHLNLALLAVVGGLGAAVWFSQKQEEKGPPLTALKQDAITRATVEHPGQPAIKLEKKDGKWRLTEPVQADTDPYEVNGILSVAELEVKSTLDAATDRKPLELDPPKYLVTLDDTRIALGGTEPIKYRRYVASGELLGLIDDPPSAALDADFSDLISKAVVPEGAELKQIEVPGLTISRNADGSWGSVQQADAKPTQVAQLAESWRNARAMWNAADPPEGSSGDAVKLTLADGRVIELIVQARDPQLILARKDLRVRYTLSKVLADELFKIPESPKEDAAADDATPAVPDVGKLVPKP